MEVAYEGLELEVIEFSEEDVITYSKDSVNTDVYLPEICIDTDVRPRS